MAHELKWRLERAYRNGDKEEVKRLNEIWLKELEDGIQSDVC